MEMKVCTKCKKELPYTEEYFRKYLDKRDDKYRLMARCIECEKKWYKEYREKNKEKTRERTRRWKKKNKERLRQHNKEWKEKNKERVIEYKINYRKENENKIREYSKKWYEENREIALAKNKKYRKENKENHRRHEQKRRASFKRLPDTLTLNEWEIIKVEFNNKCAYCGMTESEHFARFNQRLHQDHFYPLSKGGGYTADNIVPACISCNSSKRNKTFSEWYKDYEHYSKNRERFIKSYLSEVRNA